MMGVALSRCDASRLDDVMHVMEDAFDPRFGEAWTPAQVSGILTVPGVWMTLAHVEGGAHAEGGPAGHVPAGFSIARVVLDEAELLLLGVSPRFRRRGIGDALLRHFTAEAATRGAARLHLEMRDGNAAAALYRSAGFEQVGRRPKYYRGSGNEPRDALTLSLTVAKTNAS